jgi:hypothetical protein
MFLFCLHYQQVKCLLNLFYGNVFKVMFVNRPYFASLSNFHRKMDRQKTDRQITEELMVWAQFQQNEKKNL